MKSQVNITCAHCHLRSQAQGVTIRKESLKVREYYAHPFGGDPALAPSYPASPDAELKVFYAAAPLKLLNQVLARIEYRPDPNYFGPETVALRAMDPSLKRSNRIEVHLTVIPIPDPPTLVCPPALILDEGSERVQPGFGEIVVRDNDIEPGASDGELMYDLTLEVSSGELSFANETAADGAGLPAESVALSGMTHTFSPKVMFVPSPRIFP